MTKKILFFFLIYVLSLGAISAQNQKYFSKISHYTVENGLADNDVRVIIQDHKGFMWFGTRNGGVSKFDGKGWQTISKKDGLIANGILSIIQTDPKIFWLGGGGGVQKMTGKTIIPYPIKEKMGLTGRVVFSIHRDANKNLWFGTNAGAISFDGKSWKKFTMEEGLRGRVVHDIHTDKSGNTWFATRRGGLNKLRNNKWEVYLKGINCRNIFEDSENNLWIGTSQNGVIKYDGKNWTTYQKGNTLLPGTQGKDGTIWFATEGAGLVKFDGKNWTTYTTDDGLISNVVYAVIEDKKRNLWIGTDRGAMKLKRNK